MINSVHEVASRESLNAEEEQNLVRDAFSDTQLGQELLPDLSNSSRHAIEGEELEAVMENLPRNSEWRKLFLALFFTRVKSSEITSVLPFCSAKTIQRARLIKNPLQRLSLYKRKKKTRRVYSDAEVQLFAAFFIEYCPPDSGKTKKKQRHTNAEILELYKNFVRRENARFGTNFPVRCPSVFFHFRKLNKVKIDCRIDVFQCLSCACYQRNLRRRDELLAKQDLTEEETSELSTIEKQIDKAENHKYINEIQRNEYRHLRQNLNQNEIIIVMDFTAIGEFGTADYLQILVISEISRINNAEKTTYYDMFKKHKNDFNFFKFAIEKYFLEFFPQNSVQKIYFWSDGGPKHFKQKKSIYFMSTLPAKITKQIHWNFFCSDHAHNICDGHAAVLKKFIGKWKRDTFKKIPTEQEFMNMLQTYITPDQNIVPILLEEIPDPTLDVTSVEKIRQKHQFIFSGHPGKFVARNLSQYSASYPNNPDEDVDMTPLEMSETEESSDSELDELPMA